MLKVAREESVRVALCSLAVVVRNRVFLLPVLLSRARVYPLLAAADRRPEPRPRIVEWNMHKTVDLLMGNISYDRWLKEIPNELRNRKFNPRSHYLLRISAQSLRAFGGSLVTKCFYDHHLYILPAVGGGQGRRGVSSRHSNMTISVFQNQHVSPSIKVYLDLHILKCEHLQLLSKMKGTLLSEHGIL